LELLQRARELEFAKLGYQAEVGLARLDWVRERYAEAVERLQQLLAQPDLDQQIYSDVLAMLARIELAQGHHAPAARYAQEASRRYMILNSPLQALDMEQVLAGIEIQEREYERAVRREEGAYQQAQKLGITSVIASTLSSLADAYLQAGNRERALEAANEAYKIASQLKHSAPSAESLIAVGRITADLHKFDLSKDAYLQAQKAYESIGNLYGRYNVQRGLGWMYNLMEKVDEQVEAARQALSFATEYGDLGIIREARMYLALALSDNRSYEEAIQQIETVVHEAPMDAIVWWSFGWILWQAGEYDRSLEASQRALQIKPNENIVIRNVGHAYLAKGMPDEAEREYRRAIRERKGGENFIETIRSIKELIAVKPDTPRVQEMLELFIEEQKRLEALDQHETG
jgi:tetratricopeptide (TPR) repeat protein